MKKTYSWAIVVLLLFFFPPVGIWMLVSNITNKKGYYKNDSKVLKIFGWIAILIGVSYAISGITGGLDVEEGTSVTSAVIMMLLIFGSSGIFMICKGSSLAKRDNLYKKYLDVIENIGETSIENIAAIMAVKYDKALLDLREMIENGYLKGFYINFKEKRLVSRHDSTVKTNNYNKDLNYNHDQSVNNRPKKCPNCGAVNETNNKNSSCEYCGSAL